jgi:hypothetical protein
MIPGDPGQTAALRMPTRLHVKVRTGNELLRPMGTFGIDNGKTILLFIRVHENGKTTVRGDSGSRSMPKCRRQWQCSAVRQGLAIQTSVERSRYAAAFSTPMFSP